MTIPELHIKLKSLGIPEENYYLHGIYRSNNDFDKYGMAIKRGKYFIEYEIYYRERDTITSIMTFTNENEACEFFLKRVTNS